MQNLKSKSQLFEVPNTNLSFQVQVFEDKKFIAYPILVDGNLDYANAIYEIKKIHPKIKSTVTLYYNKCLSDFAADKKHQVS